MLFSLFFFHWNTRFYERSHTFPLLPSESNKLSCQVRIKPCVLQIANIPLIHQVDSAVTFQFDSHWMSLHSYGFGVSAPPPRGPDEIEKWTLLRTNHNHNMNARYHFGQVYHGKYGNEFIIKLLILSIAAEQRMWDMAQWNNEINQIDDIRIEMMLMMMRNCNTCPMANINISP